MKHWVSRPHTHCRVCQAPLGTPFLNLGEQPLANALASPPTFSNDGNVNCIAAEQRFPLQVILCEQCGLSQLSVVVNPEILYAGYRFRSGQSEAWVKHCEELAKRCTKEWETFPPGSVLDIAANDGTQLNAFARRGWGVHGVDPAPAHGIVAQGFWSQELADVYAKSWSFDLVIAQNVLGHVDDPIAFLKAIKTVLAPEGRVVVEVPNAYRMLEDTAFDTIYHEHLSYWNASSLSAAASAAGLSVFDSEKMAIHGGSLRLWMRHTDRVVDDRTGDIPAWWREMHAAFAQRVDSNLVALANIINHDADPDTHRWLGWGASAKAAVYLNKADEVLHVSAVLSAIIDDCVEKQGMLMPGVHTPVIACPESLADVDVLWLLSWNNAPALKEKAKARGFRGKFLLTNGTPRLEDA